MFLSKSATSDSAPRQPEVTVDASSPKYVYGLSGIAQLFGCSIPTANRIKKSGKIDKAIKQIWRKIIVDASSLLNLQDTKPEKHPPLAEERALTLTSSLQSRYDALSKGYRSLESATAMRIERLEREKNDLLARLKAILDMLHEKLKEAVKAFMEFSRSGVKGVQHTA